MCRPPAVTVDIHQIDELTSKTIEAQGQLDYLRMFLDIEEGGFKYFDKASSMNGGASR
jgi:hypothetical protein